MSFCTSAFADNDGWTIFVYICGSNLESEDGYASVNMQEMIDATANSSVRFIVETGGASAWQNDASPNELDRFEIAGGTSTIVDRQPQASMGDSQTLEAFLRWGLTTYPSAHNGLVFWDHGGGSITGVCFDDNFDSQSLTLRTIDDALNNTKDALPGGFDFIGYDACLMGTLENANMLSSHAKYMIGSQEVEPGTGWNYKAIGEATAADPAVDAATLGKAICDGFYQNCADNDESAGATLALIDLSKIGALCSAFEAYAEHLYDATEDETNFAPICRAIVAAENFGGNNRSEGYTNLVDLGGLVDAGSKRCTGICPEFDLFCHDSIASLFHDGQDVALSDDDILFAVQLDFRAGIFAVNDLIADGDFHLDGLTVFIDRAGADRDHFRLLRFLFRGTGKNDTALRGLFGFDLFQNDSVAQRY